MANVATPYGLYVRRCVGARRNTAGNTHYPIPANVTGAMFYGAPVAYSATGGVAPLAASPVTATPACGVVQGAQWISPIRPEWFPSLPANTYTAGGRSIEVMVNDDPGIIMMVQATATLDLTAVGKVAALTNVAAGNTQTGRSICSLLASSVAASGDLAVRIIGVMDPGAPFPDVLVAWLPTAHQVTGLSSGALVAPDAVDPEEQQQIYADFVRDRINAVRAEQGLPPVEDTKNREDRETRARKAEKDASSRQAPVPAGHKGDK